MNTYCSSLDSEDDPSFYGRLSRLIVANSSLDEVLQAILDEAVRATAACRGFLAIVDHERGELDVRYTAGEGWSEEKRLGRLKVSEDTGRGITSRVAATAEPYRAPDVLADPYYIASFEDVRSEIAVPVLDSNSRTRGVLNLESTQPDDFDNRAMCVTEILADLAATALTLADHRAREAALVQIGRELDYIGDRKSIAQKVIDVAAEVLKFEDCSLFLLDNVTQKLVLAASRGPLAKQIGKAAYEIGEGLTGWTAEHQETLRLNDLRGDPRWRGRFEEMPASDVGAFMAVPIHNRSGMTGVLRVQRRKSPYKWFPNDFTADEEMILSTIAVQLGITLDNKQLMDQLRRNERLAAWGEMSARSAHMIGNRVFAIKGDINELEYLLSDRCDPEAVLKLSESIKKGIFLLEEILNEFREFVKVTQLEVEQIDLNEVVRESVEQSFPRHSKTRLNLCLAPDLPPLSADPKKLQRCFSELVENSIGFLEDSGEITVTTALADESTRKWLGKSPRSFVMVRFQDTGPGVEDSLKPRIFNPFYTSRAKGMGLGLSIVKGIVEAHGGVIYESGKAGEGAQFTIVLPFERPRTSRRAQGEQS